MILEDKKLFASAYFDLDNDPYETRNLIMNSNYKDKIKNLIDLVVEERKEIILKGVVKLYIHECFNSYFCSSKRFFNDIRKYSVKKKNKVYYLCRDTNVQKLLLKS